MWVGIWDPKDGIMYPAIGMEHKHYEDGDFLSLPQHPSFYKQMFVPWIPAMEYADDKWSKWQMPNNLSYGVGSIEPTDRFVFDGYVWDYEWLFK